MPDLAPPLTIRSATPADHLQILALLSSSLGWVPDELHDRLFRWKHDENPFGPSPAWVATDGREVVGFRTFMRWEFTDERGKVWRAVRAVDTATHPAQRGRGIFAALTLHAVEALRAEHVDFVFNTPNDQSRPGYLKMGWESVGRLPVLVRPRGPAGMSRMLRSRVAAELWTVPCPAGQAASETLADDTAIADLLATQPARHGLATRRTPAYLRWRYGFAPLGYRTVVADDGPAGGIAIFRLRTRGAAVEAAVCEVLAPRGDQRVVRRLLSQVLRVSRADHAIAIGVTGGASGGWLPVPRQGPHLTWRAVEQPGPAPADWALTLGDIELF